MWAKYPKYFGPVDRYGTRREKTVVETSYPYNPWAHDSDQDKMFRMVKTQKHQRPLDSITRPVDNDVLVSWVFTSRVLIGVY